MHALIKHFPFPLQVPPWLIMILNPPPNSPWEPYERFRDCPFGEKFRKRWGWLLCYPFQRRILGTSFTIGEIFVVFPGIIVLMLKFLFANAQDCAQTGLIASIWAFFAIVAAQHNSILGYVIGMPFDRLIFYHIVFARIAILMSMFHAFWPIYWWTYDYVDYPGWPWGTWEVMTGFGFIGCFIMLSLTSLEVIRRNFFELFYKAHLFFVLGIIPASYLHGATGKKKLGKWSSAMKIRRGLRMRVLYPYTKDTTPLDMEK